MQRQLKARATALVAGTLTITKVKDGKQVWSSEPLPNKVVSSSGYGRNIIARLLASDPTYSLAIDSAAVGSGSTAAADGDTDLETPVATGITITNATVANNIVQFDVFVADASLANGTYREFGLFCDGRLFARILINPNYTKALGEDTLFAYTLTLSS